jgi:hypothetical protein
MARQMLQDGPYLDPPIASPLAADTATTAVLMWNPLQFTKFYGDEARPGRVYCVKAGGIMTNATTGTLIIAPGITTTNAIGTTLGTSSTNTVPGTAMTAQPWHLDSHWVVRTIGAPGGNNATIMGEGVFAGPTLTAASGAQIGSTFGGTSAVFDQSVANAIAFTKTLSVAGSFTVHWVLGYWMN